MKGTLKKKNDKWVVEYWDKLLPPNEGRSVLCELPLHPDEIITKNHTGYDYKNNTEVEFEIVNDYLEPQGDILYAKLISKQEDNVEKLASDYLKNNNGNSMSVLTGFVHGYKAAQSKQKVLPNDEYLLKAFEDSEQESWYEILNTWHQEQENRQPSFFIEWLKEHYLPPVKR